MPSRIGNNSPVIHQPSVESTPTVEQPVSVETPTEVLVDTDSFSTDSPSVSTEVVSTDLTEVPAGHVTTPLGLLNTSQATLLAQFNEVKDAISEAVSTFPEEARPGIQSALDVSASRILTSMESGAITPEEAATSLEMVREMVEGLTDLRTGEVEVIRESQHGDNVKVWNVRAEDGDELVVSTRFELDNQGEARVSIRHIVDDGVRLKGRHRMSLRLDLERWGTPSVDVQFGESSLDKRVHGLYKNPDGTVFTTPTGKKLADHHFRDNLPPTLSEPSHFSSLVESFANDVMEPLPVNLESPEPA